MKPSEMIEEWEKGCSCAIDNPIECQVCTESLIKALKPNVKSLELDSERVEELEKLFYLIKKDLLQRSEKDSDGVSIVGLGHSLWLEVKAVSDAWENK